MVDGRTYRLAATLFVKSGSQAVIRLPIGAYRIDVASSPTEMPWEEAKAVIPIPRFALQLGEADNEPSPRNRIFIDEEGKVRPSIKPSKPSPVAEKRSKRSEEHTSELQSLMRISYAVFCLKKKTKHHTTPT